MPLRLIVERLHKLVGFTETERSIVLALPATVKQLGPEQNITREGDKPTHGCAVVSGFLYRHKPVTDKEQILSFHVPGDLPDLHSLHLPRLDHGLSSAGLSTIALIPHSALNAMLDSSPRLTHAFWRESLVDASLYWEWVASLGARDALQRLAHLICEFAARLEIVGLLKNNAFDIPFTQAQISQAAGLSVVHVNRTLQELRKRRLITWSGTTVTLLDRKQLEWIADFAPEYLQLPD
jgi:CRP-like cAMP-binding protein